MSAATRQAPEGGWSALKAAELKEELEARGLPKSGKKDELVARLEADDASAEGAPEGAAAAEAPEALEADEEDVAALTTEDAAGVPVAEEEAGEPVAEEVIPPEEPAEEPSAEAVAEQPATTQPATAPERDGALVVTARAKYVRSAPRKARLVMDHIRGKSVEQAQAILRHAPRAVSDDILKLLNSAVANAESTYELGADELRIERAFVDEGPTIKRYRPRARGRATRILKRTSHMTIELTTERNGR
jgi:ribosomal protein L22